MLPLALLLPHLMRPTQTFAALSCVHKTISILHFSCWKATGVVWIFLSCLFSFFFLQFSSSLGLDQSYIVGIIGLMCKGF